MTYTEGRLVVNQWDSAPMFIIKNVLNANTVREALIARRSGVVFDLMVVIVGGKSVVQLRGRTLFLEKKDELKTLQQYPEALGESEVRFFPGIIDPRSKDWKEAMIVLDTERCTGSVTLRVK
jgi:hypothetical protein